MSAKIAPVPSYISHIHIHPLSICRTMHETLRLYHTNVKLTTIVLQVTKALRSQKAGDIQPEQIVLFGSFYSVVAPWCTNPFTAVTLQHCHYYVTSPAVISEQLMHGICTVLWHFENYYSGHLRVLGDPGHLKLTAQGFHIWANAHVFCVSVHSGALIPCGRVMQAPSTIACASSRSLHSAARAAARSASQISLRPSKAGAVSQNSSLLLLSWPSVIGYSLFHFGRSFFRGSLRPKNKHRSHVKSGHGDINGSRVTICKSKVMQICSRVPSSRGGEM